VDRPKAGRGTSPGRSLNGEESSWSAGSASAEWTSRSLRVVEGLLARVGQEVRRAASLPTSPTRIDGIRRVLELHRLHTVVRYIGSSSSPDTVRRPEGKANSLDAATDFIVVCPNCHRMLHRRTPPLPPEELVTLLRHQAAGLGPP
jgi:hypothetical protein